MVEVPALALQAEQFAAEVDFFSVGTNDLTQYTMAAERGNAALAPLLDGMQAPVLALIAQVCAAAAAHGRWVGVCGELAGDPDAAVVLVGLGVRELSMAAGRIPARQGGAAGDGPGGRGGRRAARAAARRRRERDRPVPGRRAVASARCVAIPTVTRGGLRSARLLAAGTATRIALTPVVMWLVLEDDAGDDTAVLATVLFCLAAATDWVDGRLARRWGVTSKLGSFLDTTADKLLVTGVLIALLAVDHVSPWIAALIIGRELVLMALRGVVASEGEVMAPSMLGKLKTSIQFLAIALAILRPGDPVGGEYVDEWAMLGAAVITAWSGADYLVRAWPALTQGGAKP